MRLCGIPRAFRYLCGARPRMPSVPGLKYGRVPQTHRSSKRGLRTRIALRMVNGPMSGAGGALGAARRFRHSMFCRHFGAPPDLATGVARSRSVADAENRSPRCSLAHASAPVRGRVVKALFTCRRLTRLHVCAYRRVWHDGSGRAVGLADLSTSDHPDAARLGRCRLQCGSQWRQRPLPDALRGDRLHPARPGAIEPGAVKSGLGGSPSGGPNSSSADAGADAGRIRQPFRRCCSGSWRGHQPT